MPRPAHQPSTRPIRSPIWRLLWCGCLWICGLFVGCATAIGDGGALPGGGVAAVGGPGSVTPPGSVDVGPIGAKIAWHACTIPYAVSGFDIDCGTATVPLRWEAPGSREIDLHVVRLHRTGGTTGQLWMLQGGPGFSGESLMSQALWLGSRAPDLDILLLDHRGTGRSTRLGCEAEEADKSEAGWTVNAREWPTCVASLQAQWGQDITAFSTTEAAIDLGKLIEATRQPGVPVFVYGVSYGTYWAHRYLQIWQGQAAAVVLDSVCAPGECLFNDYGKHFNEVGHALLDLCGKDSVCGQRLGADPWSKLAALFAKIDTGHCKQVVQAGLNRATLRSLLANLLAGEDERLLIPPLVYRFDRCNADDAVRLKKLASQLSKEQPVSPEEGAQMREVYSAVLYTNVAFGELWDAQATTVGQAQVEAGLLMAPKSSQDLAEIRKIWPLAALDPLSRQWASSQVPLLLLNGDLDPQTPLIFAKSAFTHIVDTASQLVVMPGAAHGIVSASQGARGDCGAQILATWLANPSGKVNLECVEAIAPLDFSNGGTLGKYFFGNGDVWDSTDKEVGQPLTGSPLAALERIRLRQRLPPVLW